MPVVSLHSSHFSQFSFGLNNLASTQKPMPNELEKQNQGLIKNKSEAEDLGAHRNIQSSTSFVKRVEGVEAYQAVASKPEVNPFAQTILNAVTGQLAADKANGATQEELQSRLDAGLEGFLTGFNEAYEQLESSGMLNDDVREQIEGTKAQVLAGIAALADELDLSYKNTEEMSGEQAQAVGANAAVGFARVLDNNQSLELGHGIGQLRDFSFSLQTTDGDLIEINAKAMKVGASYLEYGGGGASVGVAGAQQSSFAFSVEGELDEDELAAINDLLNQVNKITDTFFNGDAEDAFEMALKVGYNSDEISQFALNIQRTDIERATSSYGDVAKQGAGASEDNSLVKPQMGHKMAALGNLIRDLQEAHTKAMNLGQDKDFVNQLTEQVSRLRYEDESKSVSLSRFMNTFS